VADTEGSAGPRWKKSSWSAENGNCVEVAELPDRTIGVRDSKDDAPGRPVLTVAPGSWSSFIIGAKRGDFNLP